MEHSARPELLLAHEDFVRRLARTLLKDCDQADDVAQQTWVAALEHPPSSTKPLRSWLGRVVRNFARESHRTQQRRERRELMAARPEHVPSTADVVDRENARRSVVDALLTLPEPYRTAIILRHYEELPPRVVAKRLQISTEAARSRIKRGIAMLRDELDQEYRKNDKSWGAALLPLCVSTSRAWTATVIVASSVAAVALVALMIAATRSPAVSPEPTPTATRAAFEPRGGAAQSLQATPGASRTEVASASVTEPLAHEREGLGGDRASLRVHVTWEDGTPAPAVGLMFFSQPFVASSRRDVVTGDDGSYLFADLTPGGVWVQVDRAPPSAQMTLVAGDAKDVTLQLEKALTLAGSVVDAQGAPIARADIWVGCLGVVPSGQLGAKAAADGTFELRNINAIYCVAARASGYVPSPAYTMSSVAKRDGVPSLRIMLAAGGGAVSGLIRGIDGAPCADAVLAIGKPDQFLGKDENGLVRWSAPKINLRARSDGTFLADALEPGTNDVLVAAAGHAPWHGVVEVIASDTVNLDVMLDAGATISGRVTSHGEPVAGCSVVVELASRGFDRVDTVTASDGSFMLEHVVVGEVGIRASIGPREASARVTTQLGQTTRWDAELPSGLAIGGRVIDERGQPLANHGVAATSAVVHSSGTAQSGADGRFTIADLLAGDHVVLVFATEPYESFPLVFARAVPPGTTDLVMRVPDSARPSAHITGKVLTPEGTPPPEGWVIARPEVGVPQRYFAIDPATGQYDVGLLPPGTYVLATDVDGFQPLDLGKHEVMRDQSLDLGTSRLGR